MLEELEEAGTISAPVTGVKDKDCLGVIHSAGQSRAEKDFFHLPPK